MDVMTKSLRPALLGCVFAATLGLAVSPVSSAKGERSEASAIFGFASRSDPLVFSTPEDAAEALKSALAADDFEKFVTILGIDGAKARGDKSVMDSYAQIRDGAAKKVVLKDGNGRVLVEIGARLWPLPFPIVKIDESKWSFDTYAGFEEIIQRRVGENELQTIATVQAYVGAQEEYRSQDRDGDGVLEYAQRLISSDGNTDGLYWPSDLGAGDSPAGSALENDAALDKAKRGEGYYGYRYRIISRQGSNIAGGKHDYLINGNMIAGFALIAWPIRYGETGVHTFAVNANGTVYQVDLGRNTEKTAAGIMTFNPDDNWEPTVD